MGQPIPRNFDSDVDYKRALVKYLDPHADDCKWCGRLVTSDSRCKCDQGWSDMHCEECHKMHIEYDFVRANLDGIEVVYCYHCGERKRPNGGDIIWADLNGVPFKAYYCYTCKMLVEGAK